MLIVFIAYLVSLSIVIMIFSMIVLMALHIWIHCYTSFDLTCRLSRLYILLVVFEHGVLITIHLDCHSLYACMSDISCTLLDCMSHDCPSFAWLHVACPCGPHFYPLTSKSPGLGHFLHFGSHFCKCEAFYVLVLWLSQRLGVGSSDGLYRCTGASWRWPAHWCREESDHWRPV